MNNTLHLPCPTGEISDGYHTFDELYEHRCVLFIALMRSNPGISWRSQQHADGSMDEGWFVAGMELPSGAVTYHLPQRDWALLDGGGVRTLERAPEWDGHTPADTLERIRSWLKEEGG